MTQKFSREEFDVYVWEGTSDIASRAERCLAGMDVSLVRADAGTAFPPPRDPSRPAVALVSVSVMGDNRFSGYDWLSVQAMPVIWVASEARGRDPRYYPPEYSYTLPLAFTTTDLRKLLFELLGTIDQLNRAAPRREQPLIAVSEPMRALLAEADMFADCRSNVLIHGETGVGKERIARLLHDHAAWSDGPFVAVNCGAIPEGLFEAHFFGHAKGAFTGAVGAHKGYFEQANGGTLFLDEVGELPLTVQAKLLRVLQSGQLQRLGSDREHRVDVRLIAATNRDLAAEVRNGNFRADFYHRLSVYPLQVPPLRERGRDVLLLAGYFLEQNRSRLGLNSLRLSSEAQAALLAYAWPGNVRELEHLIGRSALKALGQHPDRPRILTLEASDLDVRTTAPAAAATPLPAPPLSVANLPEGGLREAVDSYQRQVIEACLQRHQDNWAAAARELGLDRANLSRLARRLGLR